MRLFIAINLSPELQQAAHEATAPLRDALPELRWTAPERLHLTVRFLGETDVDVAPALVAAAAKSKPITLDIGGIDAFPSLRRARVIWMGIAYEPKLELLYHDVETAVNALGFEVEGRAFRPHLTLGRVPDRLAPERARDLARVARGIGFRASTCVESVDLMRSGRPYTVLSRAFLGSP